MTQYYSVEHGEEFYYNYADPSGVWFRDQDFHDHPLGTPPIRSYADTILHYRIIKMTNRIVNFRLGVPVFLLIRNGFPSHIASVSHSPCGTHVSWRIALVGESLQDVSQVPDHHETRQIISRVLVPIYSDS